MNLQVRLRPYALPFARPLVTAVGTFAERRGLVVTVEGAGHRGDGEAAPLPGFSDESLDAVRAALERWAPSAPASVDAIPESLPAGPPSARHGAEQALLAWCAARQGTTVAALLGAHPEATVTVNALVADAEQARQAVARGFRTLKIKVARDPVDADVARVTRIREAVGPDVQLRLDANRGWTPEAAEAALRALAPLGLELVEEPTADLAANAALRAIAPIGADESVRTADHLDAVLDAGAADAVVIKPMLVGSLRSSVDMIRTAAARGVGALVTTSLEGAIGRCGAADVALAGPATLACGLDTGSWLARDLGPGPRIEAGRLLEPSC